MKKLGTLLLGMFAVLPVYAQDQAADAAAPAEAAPADAAPADATAPAADTAAPADAAAPAEAAAPADATAPAEAAAPADATAAPADAPAADAAPTDAAAAPAADTPPADAAAAPAADAAAPAADAAASGSAAPAADASASTDSSAAPAADASAAPAEAAAAPAEPAAERKPLPLYVGYDYSQVNFLASSSDSPPTPNKANQFSNNNLHGNFHQIRAGLRVFDVVGIEAHYGVKAGNGDKPDTMGVKNTMGLYFVPTGSLFDVVEISALIGYASTKLEQGGRTLSVHGSSYGANIELPLRPLFGEWMPDIRLGGGILMLHHDSQSRIYGTHYGLRYDFKV